MDASEFVIETPDGDVGFAGAGPAAEFLLDNGFANADREPHWHLRWCLDRMTVGEQLDVGPAFVARGGPSD
ncbi:hypothetical protein [Isoptericola cucumis]|uniref:Uncharacterized protein n=1 Tax=Isoptericola cucumis TaxID=1776856 RepID=A0ABQ2B4P3_9MICO|nr:hypothetical protein [Isoptericola cucumis]GGI06048.1 hypothetical protein GCM10007368_09200 [Isoptericola cucumis]